MIKTYMIYDEYRKIVYYFPDYDKKPICLYWTRLTFWLGIEAEDL